MRHWKDPTYHVDRAKDQLPNAATLSAHEAQVPHAGEDQEPPEQSGQPKPSDRGLRNRKDSKNDEQHRHGDKPSTGFLYAGSGSPSPRGRSSSRHQSPPGRSGRISDFTQHSASRHD